MVIKALSILLLTAAILGGSVYFIYELYYKEKKLDGIEQSAMPTPIPAATPDPAIAAFEVLKPELAKNTVEAREAISAYLTSYPEAPKAAEACAALGRINLALFRDPAATPSNTVYSVKKGDSLVRIAAHFKSNAELIYWANQLPSINLQIGQELLVPVIDTKLVIHRDKSTVTLFNNGLFFKEYPAVSVKLAGSAASGEIEGKVIDRIATKGETRVAFGAKDYPEAERSVILSVGGATLRTPPAPPADGSAPVTPPGVVLSPGDFSEIYVMVKPGTPFTIK